MQILTPIQVPLLHALIDNFDATSRPVVLQAGKLYTPSSPEQGALRDAVEKVKEVIRTAIEKGWEIAQNQIQKTTAYITQCAQQVNASIDQFKDAVTASLHLLIGEIFDFALKSVRSELTVGNQAFFLQTIELEQKLLLSGELEISLTSIAKFLSQGEFVVKGTYTVRV